MRNPLQKQFPICIDPETSCFLPLRLTKRFLVEGGMQDQNQTNLPASDQKDGGNRPWRRGGPSRERRRNTRSSKREAAQQQQQQQQQQQESFSQIATVTDFPLAASHPYSLTTNHHSCPCATSTSDPTTLAILTLVPSLQAQAIPVPQQLDSRPPNTYDTSSSVMSETPPEAMGTSPLQSGSYPKPICHVIPQRDETTPQSEICPHWLEHGRCQYKTCRWAASHTAANSPRYRKYVSSAPRLDFSNGMVECEDSSVVQDPAIIAKIKTPDSKKMWEQHVQRAPRANALEIKDAPIIQGS